MKIKFLFSCFILISATLYVNAQIGKEIKEFVDSTEIIVNNGRRMLEAKIIANDFIKAREIYNYLTELTAGKTYSAFYYTEDIFLNIILSDWENLTRYMYFYPERKNKRIYQNAYNIGTTLNSKIKELGDFLIQECRNTELDEESKRLTEVLIYVILNGSDNWHYTELLDSFRKDFSDTRYEIFVKDFLPPGKIKASFSFSFGSGMVLTTGNLSNWFYSSPSINMSMDFNIKRVFSSLYLNAGWPEIKQSFTVITLNDIFDFSKNEDFSYMDGGLKAGYFIARTNRFHFAPFVSASGSTLKSNRFESPDEKREYKIFSAFACGAGIHTEIKIATIKYKYPNPYGFGDSYVSLKLEGGYNYITKFKDNSFKGNIPWITMALVWGFGEY